MKKIKIDSLDDVNDFLFKVYSLSKTTFDPALDIKSLKDKKGVPVFKEDESHYFNNIMTECFVYCLLNDLNIDTLATMVQYDILHLNKVSP